MGGTSAPAADSAFADALREAIDGRGLSLDRVRAHLMSYGHDVSVATLSYWQTGRSLPVRKASVQALGALEVILRVPRGSLAAKLPTQGTRRHAPPPVSHREPVLRHGAVHDCADVLGLRWSDGFHRITQHDHLTVDANRNVARQVVTDLIVSDRDGFDRYLVGYSSDEDGVSLEIDPIEGCYVGRTVHLPELIVAELILTQTLRVGEPWRTHHALRSEGAARSSDSWQRVYVTPLREACVQVSFLPDDLPARVELYVGPDVDDAVYQSTRLDNPDLLVHRSDHGPGIIALRWDWNEALPGPGGVRAGEVHSGGVHGGGVRATSQPG
ncbi:MAG: hypothetical protein ABI746_05485 [Dermatophilaceae bacterium]